MHREAEQPFPKGGDPSVGVKSPQPCEEGFCGVDGGLRRLLKPAKASDIGYSGAGKFAGTENVLPATVRVVEPLGDEQIVHLKGPGGAPMVCKLDAHVKVAVDQRMDAHLDLERVHLFDDPTGCNISLEPEHVAHAS